jgi:hypothetical protein
MKLMIFKIIICFSSFLFMLTNIIPWVISNDFMPFWADIILMSIFLMIWLFFLDLLLIQIMRFLRKK